MVAARMGRSRKRWPREDWESIKELIRHEAILAHFTQHADLWEILLGTGEAMVLVYTENDAYRGGGGRNELDEILM
jgi:N-glycosidase YbiA